jgi:multidrug efflux pump subunit AcrB
VIRQFIAQPNVAYALVHPDEDVLQAAANEVTTYLYEIGGLFDISNSLILGKRHFVIDVNDLGTTAGLTPGIVAAQLRAHYVGVEVQRIQRGREEIIVMVRFAREQRHSLDELNDLRISLPRGGEIPLAMVATLTENRDYETLTRIDGKQAALVSAFADTSVITPMRARRLVSTNAIPMLKDRYPELEIEADLGARSERVLFETLGILVPIALLVMYALMSAFLRSYWKPLVAVVGIPVALSGALFLHLLLGWNFSAISLFGVIGVSGIIVNDALVLLHRYNTLRREQAHLPAIAVVAAASHHRFRAVLLTTLTTLLGLSPMLYERSDELLFLIPLVVSMFGGLIFATVFVLLFLPALVMLVEGRRE